MVTPDELRDDQVRLEGRREEGREGGRAVQVGDYKYVAYVLLHLPIYFSLPPSLPPPLPPLGIRGDRGGRDRRGVEARAGPLPCHSSATGREEGGREGRREGEG